MIFMRREYSLAMQFLCPLYFAANHFTLPLGNDIDGLIVTFLPPRQAKVPKVFQLDLNTRSAAVSAWYKSQTLQISQQNVLLLFRRIVPGDTQHGNGPRDTLRRRQLVNGLVNQLGEHLPIKQTRVSKLANSLTVVSLMVVVRVVLAS